MAKNSKKPKPAERRKQRQIQKDFARLQQSPNIPSSVAQSPKLPDTLSFLDGLNYQLIFKRYKHNQCELSSLVPQTARALLNKFSAITEFNNKTIRNTNLIRDKVNNTGVYAPLYDRLEDDIELVEIKFAETGRIFCYFVDDHPHGDDRVSNYCCIIAVKTRHLRA